VGTAQQPRARRHQSVPELLAVGNLVAGYVVLRRFLLRRTFGPVNHDEEDAILPDDGARLVVIQFAFTIGAGQRHFPENVLVALAAPGDGQVLFVGDALAGPPAPAGPVASEARRSSQEQDFNG